MINLASRCTLPQRESGCRTMRWLHTLAAKAWQHWAAGQNARGRRVSKSSQQLRALQGDKASPYPIGLQPHRADLAVPPWSRAWGEWSFAGEPA